MPPRAATLVDNSPDEYTSRTIERRADGWTVEISRRAHGVSAATRAFVNVGSISHLLAATEKAEEAE